jgi:hypothetical protein
MQQGCAVRRRETIPSLLPPPVKTQPLDEGILCRLCVKIRPDSFCNKAEPGIESFGGLIARADL